MKSNKVIVQEIYRTYNTCACVYVQTDYDQLVTSISIYHINLNEFQQRMNKLALAYLSVQKCKQTYNFQIKWLYRSDHLQMLDYHPGKFHIDHFRSFWEHSRTKKYPRKRSRGRGIRDRVKTCSQTSFGGHKDESHIIYHSKHVASEKVFEK
jgi:hypothetical protein